MSEHLDLEANNLCMPEDAFDKFQAVSMYQEEKFIMLSQKDPLKLKPPETEDKSPPPAINEVVVSSCNDLENSLNNKEIEDLEIQPQDLGIHPSGVEKQPQDLEILEQELDIELHDLELQQQDSEVQPQGLDIQPQDLEIQPQDLEIQPLSFPCVEPSTDLNDLRTPNKEDQSSFNVSKDKVLVSSKEPICDNDTDMVVSNSENINNLGKGIQESVALNSNVPRRRGRKPKKLLVQSEESTPEISTHIQNPDISSTPFSSDPEISDTVTVIRKKRGRPPKVKLDDQNNPLLNINDKDVTSELSSSDNRTDDSLVKTPITGRRGRPKGSGRKLPADLHTGLQENPPSSETQVREDFIPAQEVLSENTNKVSKILGKRKRKSRIQKLEQVDDLNDHNVNLDLNKTINDDISDNDDDICLSKLKSVPDQCHLSKLTEEGSLTNNKRESLSGIKDVSSESVEGQSNKLKKKRGRPKRIMATSQPIEQSEPVIDQVSLNEDSNIKDVDADDVCLSKLKKVTDDAVVECLQSEIPSREETLDRDVSETIETLEIEVSEVPSSESNILEVPNSDIPISNIELTNNDKETPSKRNTKIPVMSDFEYNIDSVLENENTGTGIDNFLLVEDTSKRPIRRKVKKFKYEEESDEDPFANVELSDDEPRTHRRGNKYYSDDEYIPGKRGTSTIVTSTDTEISDGELHSKSDDHKKQRRRKLRKKSENQTPRKRGKKDDDEKPTTSAEVTSLEQKQKVDQSDDIEICLEPTIIKTSDGESQHSQPSQIWGTTTEFENFLAKKIQGTNLKIKKVASNVSTETNKMDIPVLDPEAKKTVEMCTQTSVTSTSSVAVQTVTPYDIPMKENITLTAEQSEKACSFLNSIVKTTSELGLLMTQKSEDFIKKKINTSHVTDTSKMDYCVKKSFLLFKLAKHNLLQMEEDLAKQYDKFLEDHNLTRCREEQKKVLPTPKEINSDSDCEIVDVKPSPQVKTLQKTQAKPKPAFNPKTVFLNKELSIKIAKKPNENKKLDIKGRHTVWINDTVMVKKVKPTQSFLAQDSRNKKPPDNFITTEMLSNFFTNYYRQKALTTCSPFVSTDWLIYKEDLICNYFVVKPSQFNTEENYANNGCSINSTRSTMPEPNSNLSAKNSVLSSPDTLFTLCFHILKNQLFGKDLNNGKTITYEPRHELTDEKKVPVSLFRLCLKTINKVTNNNKRITEIEKCPTSTVFEVFANNTTTEPEKCLLSPEYEVLTNETTTKPICSHRPLPLKSLCHTRVLELLADSNDNYSEKCPMSPEYEVFTNEMTTKPICSHLYEIKPLKSLCHTRVLELLADSNDNYLENQIEYCIDLPNYLENSNDSCITHFKEVEKHTENNQNGIKSLFSLCVEYLQSDHHILQTGKNNNGVKSLFSLCVEHIQRVQHICESNKTRIITPQPLQKIALKNVKHAVYANEFIDIHKEPAGLMINCVNTLSEEAFLSLDQCNTDIPESSEYLDDFDNEDNFEPNLSDMEGDQTEPSWVSQVQMQELRSCINNTDVDEPQETEPIITQIKLEPLDYIADNLLDSLAVKSEPATGPDEMTIIPDLKSEMEEQIHAAPIQRQNSNSYDRDVFEEFVSSNKLIRALKDPEQIYSQSSERVRRQHEPDNYEESNTDMLGLLVPHTYEPMNIQTAKGSLMESSSDESNKNTKNAQKKVVVKRRGRPRKSEQKSNNKETSTLTSVTAPTPTTAPAPLAAATKEKEKQKGPTSEIAILTRKMKEKIRQEEKKNESSDSENESITVRLRSREKKDTSDQTKDKTKPLSKGKVNEIQCNNVDSTDQLDENIGIFTGFTSIETNEMSNYEKYMKFVYNKVIPEKENELLKNKIVKKSSMEANNIKNTNQINSNDKFDSPIISLNEPVELLECEPTLPIFEEDSSATSKKGVKSKLKASVPTKVNAISKIELPTEEPDVSKVDSPVVPVPPEATIPSFIDRHGWQCYPLDSGDPKLYQNACIYLEKLPESFVHTYFKYQNITSKDESDEEINRLTNLNNLNRATTLKDRKYQSSSKRDVQDDKKEQIDEDDSRTVSAVDSDHLDELLPSDDEGLRVEEEVPPPVMKQTENSLAKNLLMNDNESDEDVNVKVKKEPGENSNEAQRPKALSKKKIVVKSEEPTDLMLTADKMMNKELTLLHAPVVLDQTVKETPTKGPITRHNKKSVIKPSPPNNKTKADEDSSSEEEKQWVSTKEKLLKRMGKKESTSADDAKRAKLVSEFIERREGIIDSRKRRGVKGRRSGKRFLERQKQLRVLQRELFGETSNDPTISKRSGAAWKGRRNIRKVLDKKSLARSTVIANMEEFERKRRLNARQTKLRELLGCEEGVNVLVINDEVCLEYDFEEHRPVVTIHPFFTKVMKAHQYEGVKFMWDACFESLADIESGHAGGGCILAHCMGLGKTLQVLALLHTVLTHPRVGMQRVLVCCPLSTVLNWVDEIHKWLGPVTNQIKVFELSKLKKTYERAYQLEDWYNGGGIFIIGYELFRSLSTLDPLFDDVRPTIVNKIRTALLDPGPDIIVCDEGHLLKNDCSVLAVSMSRVVTKRRIVLTGTPMQNNLREYYCMVNFVKPNLLGTYAEYSNRFENPIMNGQHRDSREEDIKLMKARTHILHKVLEGCLQRQEVSVLYPYLPKKHEYTVFITLTKCQWDLYKHYLNNYCSRQVKQNSILRDFHILQKIWSHPQVLHNFQTKAQEARNKVKLEKLEDDLATEDQREVKEEIATDLWWLQYLEGGNMLDSLEVSNKFVVVFRILDECVALGDKVLIFSTSLFCLDSLEYFLKKINKWSLGQEYYRLDGSVPAEVRQKWCREFNAENNVNTKVFLVSTRAGCLGLNMTAANRVIIMDTSWNPAHDIQSIFRVYRFGQKKDCYIYRLVALGTMEQKIYERSVTKQAVSCRVVDEQQIDRHYNMAELTELYRYDESGVSVAGGVAVGVSDVALLRVARETALHAVHEHDSLLRSSEQGLPEHERAAAWMQFQQEQAHKQMENKLITNIPKMSLRRLQGDHYTQTFELNDIKLKTEEIKVEDTSEDFVPPNEVRSKRGRRISKIVIPVPPTTSSGRPVGRPPKAGRQRPTQVDVEVPGTSTHPRQYINKKQYDEEMMVTQITEILIKHDFQNRHGNTDITNLVAKVRKIVNQGYIFKDDSTDDLTTSIAKVLLANKMTMPIVTGIMCDSINNSINPATSQEEPEHILSDNITESLINIPDTRRKRKARNMQEEPESILSTSENEISVLDGRRKRRSEISHEEPEHILSTGTPESTNVPDSRRTRRSEILQQEPEHILSTITPDSGINVPYSRRTRSELTLEEPEHILNTRTSESVINVPNGRRKRKSEISHDEPEHILSTGTSESVLNVPDGRRKRRSDISQQEPEPNLNTGTSESVINVPDGRRKRRSEISYEEPEHILSTGTPESAKVSDSRRTRRSQLESENILTSENVEDVPDSSRIRKDAKGSTKHMDSIAQDVIINLDDEFDNTDVEFVPDNINKPEKSHLNRRKSSLTQKRMYEEERTQTNIASASHSSTTETNVRMTEANSNLGDTNIQKPTTKLKSKPKAGPKTYKDKLRKEYQQITQNFEPCISEKEMNSTVLLSEDNDEPLVNVNAPTTSTTTVTYNQTSKSKPTTILPEDTEPVPLPLSLLTNKNFINIVAHTYLNGNPMLDADAATLAAQYSTFKALKEAEATGKDITTGPIYDIAAKVIGKKLFQRMNNVNVKTNKLSVEEANVTIELKEKMQEMSENKSKEIKKEKSRNSSFDILSPDLMEAGPSQPIANQYPNGNVVPVGLIKTMGNVQSNEFASSECILPDDDDAMHIVPHDLPALPQLQPAPVLPVRVTTSLHSRANSATTPTGKPANASAPILYNHILADKKAIPDIKPVIKICKGKIIMPASVTSGNSSQFKIAPVPPPQTTENEAICLDSDEEDIITPTAVPSSLLIPQANLAPVPVSLTVGHLSEIPSMPLNIAPVISTQGIPQKSLVIRPVASGGGPPKFVLVPASSIPASKVSQALPLPKEKPTTSSVQQKPTSSSVQQKPMTSSAQEKPTTQSAQQKPTTSSVQQKPTTQSAQQKPTTSSVQQKPTTQSAQQKPTTSSVQQKPTTSSAQQKPTTSSVQQKPTTPSVQQKSDTTPKESILSTTSPSATCLNKLKEARCKPGDIIKISEKGDIQVLQVTKNKQLSSTKISQNDVTKQKSSLSAVAKSKNNNQISNAKDSSSTILKSKQSKSEVAKHQSKLQTKSGPSVPSGELDNQTTKTRTLSISSSSSESRPASPADNNPLSILKNVVHIQAADDTPSTSKEYQPKGTRTQKADDANVYVQHVYASDSKTSTKAAAGKIVTTQHRTKEESKTKSLPKSKDIGKSTSNKSSSGIDKVAANKLLGNLLFNKKAEKKAALASGSKAVGDTKCNPVNNKTFHTVDLTQLPKVTVGSGASILMTKIEAKKRTSTGEPSTPKKKKTEPMTLKDFSLDDIDDIIELD